MVETYFKVKGAWKYLYSAVDKQGQTVDFLLTTKCDASADRRFFEKTMQHNEVPNTVTMIKNGTDKAALEQLNAERVIPIGSDRSSISTISSSRIIVPSNASSGQCSGLNRSEWHKLLWPASSSCI